MRADDDVFIMGEDIAEMGGSMGVTQGMLDEFGAGARAQHADLRDGARRRGDRRRDAGHAPGRRDHVRGLHDARRGAGREPGGEAPLHVGRAGHRARRLPHAGRRRLVAGRAARAAARGVVRAHPRAEGRVRRRRRRTCAACSGRRSTTTTRSSSSSTARSIRSRARCPRRSSRSRSARRACTARART